MSQGCPRRKGGKEGDARKGDARKDGIDWEIEKVGKQFYNNHRMLVTGNGSEMCD